MQSGMQSCYSSDKLIIIVGQGPQGGCSIPQTAYAVTMGKSLVLWRRIKSVGGAELFILATTHKPNISTLSRNTVVLAKLLGHAKVISFCGVLIGRL
jgi:hypothetical protein